MVQEKARLLTATHIDVEAGAVLVDVDDFRGLGAEQRSTRPVGETVGAAGADVAALEDAEWMYHLVEGGHQLGTQAVHSQRVQLHDEESGVFVDDQPGQAVALTVNEAACIGICQLGVAAAQLDGAGDAALEELRIDGVFGAAAEHAHGDGGAGVVVAAADEASLAVDDIDDVAGGDRVIKAGDRTAVHPRMAFDQQAFTVAAQLDLGIAGRHRGQRCGLPSGRAQRKPI